MGKFDNRLVLGYNLYMRNVKFLQVGSNSVVVPDVYNVSNRQGELTGFEEIHKRESLDIMPTLLRVLIDTLHLMPLLEMIIRPDFIKPTDQKVIGHIIIMELLSHLWLLKPCPVSLAMS